MTVGVGARLARIVAAGGVKAIFGVPGGQTRPLYRAVGAAGVDHVLMRDERSAAYAADAYARIAGRVGVCDATVGPGVTNLVSGLAEAYSSSVPVIAIIADIRTTHGYLRERGVVSQAINQSAILAPITKWVGRVERAEALDDVFDQALRVATTGRPGPVCLEVPEDVFLEMTEETRIFGPGDFTVPRFRSAPPADLVERAADLIAQAQRPLILAGGGIGLSGAEQAITDLAEEHQIPVVTSISGKGSIDERGPLAAGVTGMFGNFKANAAMMAADTVIAIGSKFSQLTTHGFRVPNSAQTIIHIDIDGEEIGRTGPVTLGICADAREAATALAAALRGRALARRNWLVDLEAEGTAGTVEGESAVPPIGLANVISDALGPDDILICDASLSSGWGSANFKVKKPGRSFLAPRGLAGIGWAAGATIGARMAADPGRKMVSLAGDGAWGYSLTEVETAVRIGADVTYVILNNSGLAWIAHGEARLGMAPSRFAPTDFAAVARAMGAGAVRVNDLEDFAEHLHRGLAEPGPYLIDVVSSFEASPIVSLRDVPKGVY